MGQERFPFHAYTGLSPWCLFFEINRHQDLSTFQKRLQIRHEMKIWRRGGDSNPRHPFGVKLLSRQPCSATPAPLRGPLATSVYRSRQQLSIAGSKPALRFAHATTSHVTTPTQGAILGCVCRTTRT